MNRDQNKQFDEQLRQRLTDWQSAAPPKGWDQLAHALDQGQHAFDEVIRDKLQALPPALVTAPKGWETLAKQLDEQASDQVYHQKLRQATVPAYQRSGWVRLAARLELIAQRRSAIAAYKITEIALLLSAVLIFWQYSPSLPSTLPLTVAQLASPPAKAVAKTSPEASSTVASATATTGGSTAAAAIASPMASQQLKSIGGAYLLVAPKSIAPERPANHAAQPIVNSPLSLSRPIGAVGMSSRLGHSIATSALPTGQHLTAEGLNLLAEEHPAPSPSLEIAVACISPTELLQLPERTPLTYTTSPLVQRAVNRQHHLRFFVSPWDINQVVTPAFLVGDRKIGRDVRFSSGRSAGLLLDVTHGKHGHSYGLIYSRRSYLPTIFADAESALNMPRPSPLARVDTNYSRITFQTVSLPFSYQRLLLKKGKWRLRANVGVEVNLVLKAKFYKSPNFDNNITDFIRNAGGGSAIARSSEFRELNATDLIHPEKGLLQGGSALLNTSFYLGGGFTIEHQLGSYSSLFVSPQFTRAVYYRRQAGLGPFGDRIHHNALQMGMRWRLD